MRNVVCTADRRVELALPVELGDVTHFAVNSESGVLYVAGSGLGVAAYRSANGEVRGEPSVCNCGWRGQQGRDRRTASHDGSAAAAAATAAASCTAAACSLPLPSLPSSAAAVVRGPAAGGGGWGIPCPSSRCRSGRPRLRA